MSYAVRDHDAGRMAEKLAFLERISRYLNDRYGAGTVELKVEEQYRNMAEKIAPMFSIVELIEKSMERQGISPQLIVTRGGTDGSRLSFMGIPCPNICTGVSNGHSRYEFVSVQSMKKITALLIEIVSGFYTNYEEMDL